MARCQLSSNRWRSQATPVERISHHSAEPTKTPSTITQGADSLSKTELIPNVTAEVWPNTTHSLPMQVPKPLAEKLAAFWASGDD